MKTERDDTWNERPWKPWKALNFSLRTLRKTIEGSGSCQIFCSTSKGFIKDDKEGQKTR